MSKVSKLRRTLHPLSKPHIYRNKGTGSWTLDNSSDRSSTGRGALAAALGFVIRLNRLSRRDPAAPPTLAVPGNQT